MAWYAIRDSEMDPLETGSGESNPTVGDGMLEEYNFGDEGNQEVVDFMVEKSQGLEKSLRMVQKLQTKTNVIRHMESIGREHLYETCSILKYSPSKDTQRFKSTLPQKGSVLFLIH